MKNLLYTLIISALILAGAGQAQAQKKCDDGWKEKMMSEKIAFLTHEINITPEEAQAFWPVYNKIEKEKDEARHQAFKSHKAMSSALEEGKSEKELSALLDAYVAAKVRQDEVDNGATEIYKTVLPLEKVVKLYVAEEKFRRQYIHKLHKGSGEKR